MSWGPGRHPQKLGGHFLAGDARWQRPKILPFPLLDGWERVKPATKLTPLGQKPGMSPAKEAPF